MSIIRPACSSHGSMGSGLRPGPGPRTLSPWALWPTVTAVSRANIHRRRRNTRLWQLVTRRLSTMGSVTLKPPLTGHLPRGRWGASVSDAPDVRSSRVVHGGDRILPLPWQHAALNWGRAELRRLCGEWP